MDHVRVRTATLFVAYGTANALSPVFSDVDADRRVMLMIVGALATACFAALRAALVRWYDDEGARASAVLVPAACTLKALEFTAGLFAANMLTVSLQSWGATTRLDLVSVAANAVLVVFAGFALLFRSGALYQPLLEIRGHAP